MAYIIIAHKDFPQLKRLIESLQDPETCIFLCVDDKSKTLKNHLEEYSMTTDNLIIVEKTFTISWGGFNMVRAVLEGMRAVLSSGYRFRYVSLISGQDYPLKSNQVILDFFRENNKEYIHAAPLPVPQWNNDSGGIDRVQYYYDMDDNTIPKYEYVNIMNTLDVRKPPLKDYTLYGGLQWWTLTSKCVQYICDFVHDEYEFFNFFKYSAVPDEMFFQTIIMNSHFKDTVENNALRFLKWNPGSPHPSILRERDFHTLSHSQMLWGRKFDSTVDSNIIDLIDTNLR